jgi:hypothetical protein
MTRTTPLLVLATLVAACTAADGGDDDGGWSDGKADGSSTPVYASATTVEEQAAGIVDGAPGMALHMKPMGSLGHFGPIGEYGPLGVLGPVGTSAWNPSSWIGATGWDGWASLLTDVRGPLSADGPLGSSGPLSSVYWRDTFDGDVAQHLLPGGAATPLGPVGPLGALGPLGPLGPVGAHGFRRDTTTGDYTGDCNGDGRTAVCRTVDVEWTAGGTVRTWPLVELYPEAAAARKTDHDTSFVVQGEIARAGDTDRFTAHAGDAQWVTVVVLPEHSLYNYAQGMAILATAVAIGFETPAIVAGVLYDHDSSFDDFDLEIDVAGIGTAVSATSSTIDWAIVRVPAGATLDISITLYKPWTQWWRPYNPRYRLFVIGSTKYLAPAAATGPQLQPL